MDVDDDDECMNAFAAHAAFVMTVSAAMMYWLLRHAQHVRYINIHKLHPLQEKSGCALPLFRERELTFTFAICYHPSVCHLSAVCLSVCRLSVMLHAGAPYSGG